MSQPGTGPFPPQPPGYPGGGPWAPGPPPKRNRTGLVVGLVAVALVAVVLVVVLTNRGDDDATPTTPGGTGGSSSADRPGTARPVAPPTQSHPAKAFEQVALDYVSAVQNKDLASAKALACASYRGQVSTTPTLRSPTGVTVTSIDAYRLSGSNSVTDSSAPDVVLKANVGVDVTGAGGEVQWVFRLAQEGGVLHVCGLSVVDSSDLVPEVN